ncbi:hypothetical protein NtRootA4_19240 [Arthrobacter sp. NtRootA4]|jgi:hypothetical protein|nr:hypothetical protein NtRootA2_21440 [Arthrobacter sp. NtRootA2]BCW14945.1 hypothetical protein NtRootA4_19240 [Arthrobacter sp. NtRootA4]BCW23280.1 hypothetical protein NtRootC7_21470 [Arthrobacter sp. NtRootC7]BCW27548.1 hypothetical protein NtRootC45_21480 [Arthrobacter sp. NtRootC45]BCW31815.1 hypothetical protein NtRootD5_21460 [Arthrobacter sp. NtRootD5]
MRTVPLLLLDLKERWKGSDVQSHTDGAEAHPTATRGLPNSHPTVRRAGSTAWSGIPMHNCA